MMFDDYIAGVITAEGGYSNNPDDSGGETNFGITVKVARENSYFGPMREMSIAVATSIYKQKYWFKPGFDKIEFRDARLAMEMLDTGVNMGIDWPGRFLQRALNVLNKGNEFYPNLEVDGKVGPATLAALDKFLAIRGIMNGEVVLLRLMNAQQGVRYMELAEASPKNEQFLYGWVLNRLS